MTMDVVAAAQNYLASDSTLVALLGSSTAYATWIFQGIDETTEPWVNMEGTGKACVMVWQQGGWTAPNLHNNMHFPKLNVEVFADPLRDAMGNVISRDIRSIFKPIWDELDRLLHRPQGGSLLWGDLWINNTIALEEWDVFPWSDADGVKISRKSFAVTY